MERFHRKEGGARKLPTKEQNGLFQARSSPPRGRARGLTVDYRIFLWGMKRCDRLPHWCLSENLSLAVKTPFLLEVETPIRLSIKPPVW